MDQDEITEDRFLRNRFLKIMVLLIVGNEYKNKIKLLKIKVTSQTSRNPTVILISNFDARPIISRKAVSRLHQPQ